MTRNPILLSFTLCAAFALGNTAFGQSTQNIPISGGTGFSGVLDGMITATVKASGGGETTEAFLDVTDLDIEVKNDGGFLNFFPNDTSNDNTAFTTIDVAPTVIGIDLDPTAFSSPVSGSVSVTAGDGLTNAAVGLVDGGIPGGDGKWDDPGKTGILNSATADSVSVTLDNSINASAAVTGSISATLPSDVTIPDVVDTSVISADLRIKSSSNVSVDFSPVQGISLQDLTISTSTPISLTDSSPVGNFSEGHHPAGGAAKSAMLDLSAGGGDLVETTISGTLVADIMGTISGSIDIAADISVIGIINTTVDQDNVVDGLLSDGTVSLIDLNQEISLPDTELPFIITVLHEATTDVDFDDVIAQIISGTLGFTVPISLLEEDVVLELPPTSFELSELSTHVDAGSGQHGDVIIHHLAATLGGTLVLDLAADLELTADLFAEAYQANAINVVPEPGSISLMALAGLGLVGYYFRRRRPA